MTLLFGQYSAWLPKYGSNYPNFLLHTRQSNSGFFLIAESWLKQIETEDNPSFQTALICSLIRINTIIATAI
jgi:hypothetical protein